MRIKQISETSTTSGSISTVATPLMSQTRESANVRGLKPVGKVMSGTAKKKGPYANSIIEGKVKDLAMDLKATKDGLSDIEFKKKYGKTKDEVRKEMAKQPKKVSEATLEEEDIILVPGQGRIRRTGFVKNDPDRAEHEGQTLKNSLHTIIRVATHLDKELSTRDNFPEWVSEKIGATKSMMVSVMDYLISAKEMQHDPDAMEGAGVIAGGLAYESKTDVVKKTVKKNGKTVGEVGIDTEGSPGVGQWYMKCFITGDDLSGYDSMEEALEELKYCLKQDAVSEGAKVDRMVKHVKQSEKKLGHSDKEAENIAWATANKRGMLDNKNKKK